MIKEVVAVIVGQAYRPNKIGKSDRRSQAKKSDVVSSQKVSVLRQEMS